LETWLEASPLGSMIYARNGFGFVHTVELRASAELGQQNEESRHCEEASKDFRRAVMRRPVNGAWKTRLLTLHVSRRTTWSGRCG
jgi:hypothetical protein